MAVLVSGCSAVCLSQQIVRTVCRQYNGLLPVNFSVTYSKSRRYCAISGHCGSVALWNQLYSNSPILTLVHCFLISSKCSRRQRWKCVVSVLVRWRQRTHSNYHSECTANRDRHCNLQSSRLLPKSIECCYSHRREFWVNCLVDCGPVNLIAGV